MGLEFYGGLLAGVGVCVIAGWVRSRARYRTATRHPTASRRAVRAALRPHAPRATPDESPDPTQGVNTRPAGSESRRSGRAGSMDFLRVDSAVKQVKAWMVPDVCV